MFTQIRFPLAYSRCLSRSPSHTHTHTHTDSEPQQIFDVTDPFWLSGELGILLDMYIYTNLK